MKYSDGRGAFENFSEKILLSKIGTSLLHGACGGTGVLRCDLSKIGASGSNRCRMGCHKTETLTHIIKDCIYYKDCRLKLMRECDRLKLAFTVNNAMCHPDLHLLTENFFTLLNDNK